MKKICTALFLAFSSPLSAFAISLADIQNTPERYETVTNQQGCTYYVDNSTFKGIKTMPPYSAIECIYYKVDSINKSIIETPTTFSYDSNRDGSYILHIGTYGPISSMVERMEAELMRDPGIQYSSDGIKCYDFDGTFKNSPRPTPFRKCIFKSPEFLIGNFIYEKYYGKRFTYES